MADVVAVRPVGSGRPRITFTVFRSAEDPMLRSWLRFRSPLTGAPVPDELLAMGRATSDDLSGRDARADSSEPGFWRLLASNNRELGRSYLLYRSFEHARSHVQQLQAGSDALDVAFVSGPRGGGGGGPRGWVVTFDGAPVMTCSRWYDSTSARAAAATVALAALPVAHLADNPDRSGPSGRFLRRVDQSAGIA